MGRAEDTGSRTIYDHPGNVDSIQRSRSISASLGNMASTERDLGEGQINLGHVKSGEIYERI